MQPTTAGNSRTERSRVRKPSLSQTSPEKLDKSEQRRPGLKFSDCEGFHRALRARGDLYFAEYGRRSRDLPAMYRKTAVILAWCVASYGLLLFWASAWWHVCLLAPSLGLAMAAIGFNVQHDGGHSAYSKRRWVNKFMSMTMDVIGGSSYMWKQRHNIIHHTYTNITGHDGDIDLGTLGRLTPHQPRRGFHQFQHLYLWVLYGFVSIKWQLLDDFYHLIRGEIGETRFPRPKGWELVLFIGGKVVFYTLAFVVPMMMFPWYLVLGVYCLASFVQGLVMSIVFQLAHVLEGADFPLPKENSNRMEAAWAAHQVQTTVNFAMRNPIVCWYTGGLNFQIEHHLFPHICHLNYPGLSKVVEEVCREYGLNYAAHNTVREAMASHYQWLKELGQPEVDA